MKKIILSIVLLIYLIYPESHSNQLYIPPMDTIIVPSGSIICTDTLYIDSSACLVLGDTSCVCPGTKILGSGYVLIGINENIQEIPVQFILYQNYPNPFNPVTKIKFDIPAVGQRHAFDLRVIIYDILGQEISVLVNEQLNPGNYEVEWDASNYTSGVYYYRMTAGNYTETKKMVLIK